MVKKGDTLIEVALAIGVFSMIAISIASVISSSTSGAQLSLETTLAREEVDTQAETIRFIHNSYSSNKENASQPLAKLWKTITENAVKLNSGETEAEKKDNESIVQYNPSTCDELYDESKSTTYNYAFIINPRELNSGESAYKTMKDAKDNKGEKILQKASTYPRLIFSAADSADKDNDNTSSLQNSNNYTNLYRAEGIYVVAVKDPNGTNIVSAEGDSGSSSAYYDFYIRTCWYGTGNDEPSTISTVIRLHDPDSVEVNDTAGSDKGELIDHTINYYSNNEIIKTTSCPSSNCWVSNEPSREGYNFGGWCTVANTVDSTTCSGKTLNSGTKANAELFNNKVLNLYAIWTPQVKNSKTVSVSLTNSERRYFRLKDLSLCVYGGECAKPPKCSLFGGCTSPTITLDVFEDKNYYFYVKDEPNFWDEFGGLDNLKGASVTVTDKTTNETTTFDANTIKSKGLYWNVFAYKNGQIVERQTRSRSPETNY